MKKLFIVALFFAFAMPPVVFADDVEVTVQTKQGGEWIDARQKDYDDGDTIEISDALPGKYILDVDEDDMFVDNAIRRFDVEIELRDEEGRSLREDAKVDLYIYIGDMKAFLGTVETDDNGAIDVDDVPVNTTVELDVRDDGKVKKRDGMARIKVKAKIDDADWVQALYQSLEPEPSGQTNGMLEIENVLPGKYKFKVKSGDPYDPAKPFVLKARMRDEDGKKIKKPMKVTVYSYYAFGVRTKIAEVQTDDKGWVLLSPVHVGEKYKLKVKKIKK